MKYYFLFMALVILCMAGSDAFSETQKTKKAELESRERIALVQAQAARCQCHKPAEALSK